MSKKIVFLVPSLGMGGMERVLVNYANLFVKYGFDVCVYNFSYDDDAIISLFDKHIRYRKNYIPVPHISHAGWKDIYKLNFRVLKWEKWIHFHSPVYLYKKYIQDDFDVEVAFFGGPAMKIISGSTNADSARIGWVHNSKFISTNTKAFSDMNLAYYNIDKLICVSETCKDNIVNTTGRRKKTYVVNNPNNTEYIRNSAKKSCPLINDKFTFVTVGRFVDKDKGYIRLLNVCNRLKQDGYDFQLWMVGNGTDFDRIRNHAVKLGLDNVVFAGQQANPYPYIKNADVYVCSSYFEGFSMVMMEAIILGTPMITTDVSGANEMLNGGEYGMIVHNDEDALYDGMKKYLSDVDTFDNYKSKAQLRMDYFTEDAVMERVLEIINE